jgi:hypothetical protein
MEVGGILQWQSKNCPFVYLYIRIAGFNPIVSPPLNVALISTHPVESSNHMTPPSSSNLTYHNSLLSSSLIFSSSSSSHSIMISPMISSRSPVSLHNRSAKFQSSTLNRSFTRSASPFLGFPGVVVRGRLLRKET